MFDGWSDKHNGRHFLGIRATFVYNFRFNFRYNFHYGSLSTFVTVKNCRLGSTSIHIQYKYYARDLTMGYARRPTRLRPVLLLFSLFLFMLIRLYLEIRDIWRPAAGLAGTRDSMAQIRDIPGNPGRVATLYVQQIFTKQTACRPIKYGV